jgi:hypothetical protein
MRNNETGEFELIVGNRQLLSGFFIVVLLFAVAFAMGYVVGQNSPRSTKGENTAAASPSVSEPRPQPAAAAPEQAKTEPAPAPTETASAQPPSADPAPQQPAQQPPATQTTKAPERPENANEIPVLAELPGPAGAFWQVIALAQPDAEVIASALKKKGFPVFLSPGTKNLIRVMVGPYNDAASLGKAKTDLASAGFPNPFRK